MDVFQTLVLSLTRRIAKLEYIYTSVFECSCVCLYIYIYIYIYRVKKIEINNSNSFFAAFQLIKGCFRPRG